MKLKSYSHTSNSCITQCHQHILRQSNRNISAIKEQFNNNNLTVTYLQLISSDYNDISHSTLHSEHQHQQQFHHWRNSEKTSSQFSFKFTIVHLLTYSTYHFSKVHQIKYSYNTLRSPQITWHSPQCDYTFIPML